MSGVIGLKSLPNVCPVTGADEMVKLVAAHRVRFYGDVLEVWRPWTRHVIGRGLEALPAQLTLILTSLVTGAATMMLIGGATRTPIGRRPISA